MKIRSLCIKSFSLMLMTSLSAFAQSAIKNPTSLPKPKTPREKLAMFLYNKTQADYDRCKQDRPQEFQALDAVAQDLRDSTVPGTVKIKGELIENYIIAKLKAYEKAGRDCDKIIAARKEYINRLMQIRDEYIATASLPLVAGLNKTNSIYQKLGPKKFKAFEDNCLSKYDPNWGSLSAINKSFLYQGMGNDGGFIERLEDLKAATSCQQMIQAFKTLEDRIHKVDANAAAILSDPFEIY